MLSATPHSPTQPCLRPVLQVKDRLQQVWANWRKLTPQQQRTWAERQLGELSGTCRPTTTNRLARTGHMGTASVQPVQSRWTVPPDCPTISLLICWVGAPGQTQHTACLPAAAPLCLCVCSSCLAAKDGAAAVKQVSGKAAPGKAHGSLWAAESSAAMKAIGAHSSRKKPDGWTFSRAPSHAGERETWQTPPLSAVLLCRQQEGAQDSSAVVVAVSLEGSSSDAGWQAAGCLC